MQKQDEKKVPDVKRDGWSAEELAQQSVNEDSDETTRKVLRGNENQGNPNDRDIAGAADTKETPQGSEENKHQAKVEKNG